MVVGAYSLRGCSLHSAVVQLHSVREERILPHHRLSMGSGRGVIGCTEVVAADWVLDIVAAVGMGTAVVVVAVAGGG